jgi:hypothetical protein
MKPAFYLPRVMVLFFVVSASHLLGGKALAATPVTPVFSCTSAAQNFWLSEAKLREVFGDRQYLLVQFKVSRGNCYEFYAIAKDGSIVEAYYDPASAKLLRFNRLEPHTGKSTNTLHTSTNAQAKLAQLKKHQPPSG